MSARTVYSCDFCKAENVDMQVIRLVDNKSFHVCKACVIQKKLETLIGASEKAYYGRDTRPAWAQQYAQAGQGTYGG